MIWFANQDPKKHSPWQPMLGPKKKSEQIYLYRTKGTYCGYMGDCQTKKFLRKAVQFEIKISILNSNFVRIDLRSDK